MKPTANRSQGLLNELRKSHDEIELAAASK